MTKERTEKPTTMRKMILVALLFFAIGVYVSSLYSKDLLKSDPKAPIMSRMDLENYVGPNHRYQTMLQGYYKPEGLAGSYLSSLFAQNHQDWGQAYTFLQKNVKADQNNEMLQKRLMILASGSGNFEKAFQAAEKILEINETDSLSLMFVAIKALKQGDLALAKDLSLKIEEQGISDFVQPVLKAWVYAANNELNIDQLTKNPIQSLVAARIAHFLGDKEKAAEILDSLVTKHNLKLSTLNEIADLYVTIDKIDAAKKQYEHILKGAPQSAEIQDKLTSLENEQNKELNFYSAPKNAQEGLAKSLYETARLLYSDYSDSSARIFGNLAIYLAPNEMDYRLFLAGIIAESDQYEDAIAYYKTINPSSDIYITARREIAELYEDNGRLDEAIAELQYLEKTHKSVDAIIQMGDVQRRSDDFKAAIKSYNKAFGMIGVDNIIPDYWHLYYVRGMAYERIGEWRKAEKDLLAALDHKPDNPYVLNYLGYSWADKGVNLNRSLEMIKKANKFAPNDGYITDSVGWVLYRLGRYEEAVPYLEKAVALMPGDAVINDHLGDVYWQVDRIREAKFQWERAKNNLEDDPKLLAEINEKLEKGLLYDPQIQHASTDVQEFSDDRKSDTP